MSAKDYESDQIITLDFDGEPSIECGIMGIFDVDGQDYIALEALDGSDDVYLYGYRPGEDDFELLDIDEDLFDRVSAEFESIMNDGE